MGSVTYVGAQPAAPSMAQTVTYATWGIEQATQMVQIGTAPGAGLTYASAPPTYSQACHSMSTPYTYLNYPQASFITPQAQVGEQIAGAQVLGGQTLTTGQFAGPQVAEAVGEGTVVGTTMATAEASTKKKNEKKEKSSKKSSKKKKVSQKTKSCC